MKYGFGIDLGGTTVKLAFFNSNSTMLHKWEIPTVTDNAGERILPDIAAAIRTYLTQAQISDDQLLGIGIGVPGAVTADGVVHQCDNLGWGVFSVEQQLHTLTGLPVKAGNDASVAALGECWKGSGQNYRNLVLVTLGTGVGGGIVVDGQLTYGAHGACGELGHMVLNRTETRKCGCGKCGCVEQYCSATGIVRMAKDALQVQDHLSSLRSLGNITCKDVFDAAAAGDDVSKAVLEQFYRYLGEFLANIACVIDPEVIVLGGGVSKAGPAMITSLRPHFAHYAYHACRDIPITIASLGNDAGAYGAFKLALDAFGA